MSNFVIILFYLVCRLAILNGSGALAMEKVHVTSPEPVVFLKLAAQILEEYHQVHHVYARKWPELDITFVNGPYRMTDPDIRPSSDVQQIWHPKNCEYTYRLATNASGSKFRVDALDRVGNIVYYITSDQTEPVPTNPK
jgi:hypothetical protein